MISDHFSKLHEFDSSIFDKDAESFCEQTYLNEHNCIMKSSIKELE